MSRIFLLVLIATLTIGIIAAGYMHLQERQSGIDVEIEIDEHGASIKDD